MHTDVQRRISKCLALTQSSNIHEAAAALRQAMKLCEVHQLRLVVEPTQKATHALRRADLYIPQTIQRSSIDVSC